MISKELLSEVLNIDISNRFNVSITTRENNIIVLENSSPIYKSINIYELAHKCKEWAHKNGYGICSFISSNSGICLFDTLDTSLDSYDKSIKGSSEPEAIFKVCEWIMENNNGTN